MTQGARRDEEFIAWLNWFVREHRYAPSIRDIAKAFGYRSTGSVSIWMQRLRDEGKVEWRNGEARTLRTVHKGS